MAQQFGCSQTNVRHWLKKHGLLSIRINEVGSKLCSLCSQSKPIGEFFERENGRSTSRCKNCLSLSKTQRDRDNKSIMIDYKGGKCIRCGYDRCHGALEFHHRNLDEKEVDPSAMKNRKFNSNVQNELDKCDLLCSVCHREVHYEWTVDKRSFNKDITLQNEPTKCCTKCGDSLPLSSFYRFTGSADGLSWECKPCNYQRKTAHKNKIKVRLIEGTGRKVECECCGYNRCVSALEFHHVDRNEKEVFLSDIQSLKLCDEYINEALKCTILCSNCHREIHW